jgi:hypothetical protein
MYNLKRIERYYGVKDFYATGTVFQAPADGGVESLYTAGA